MYKKDVSVSLLWLIVMLFFGVGLLGTVIPGLPGMTLIYIGILVYSITTDFARISLPTVIAFGCITAITLMLTSLGSAAGTRLGGGRKWAITGTITGALVGALGGPAGLLVGGFFGALLGALFEGGSSTGVFKIALFSVLGVLGTVVIQFLLGVALIIAFLVAVFS